MSTRAVVAVLQEGTIAQPKRWRGAYVHFDGGATGVGSVLWHSAASSRSFARPVTGWLAASEPLSFSTFPYVRHTDGAAAWVDETSSLRDLQIEWLYLIDPVEDALLVVRVRDGAGFSLRADEVDSKAPPDWYSEPSWSRVARLGPPCASPPPAGGQVLDILRGRGPRLRRVALAALERMLDAEDGEDWQMRWAVLGAEGSPYWAVSEVGLWVSTSFPPTSSLFAKGDRGASRRVSVCDRRFWGNEESAGLDILQAACGVIDGSMSLAVVLDAGSFWPSRRGTELRGTEASDVKQRLALAVLAFAAT